MNNKPPAVSLELDKDEAKWLHGLLSKAHSSGNAAFKEACTMPSTDPRAKFRALLTMAANVDQITSEQIAERMQNQQAELESDWNADRKREQDT